ncbi:hypothetical protein Vadar_015771 [Vaccinium darrowii]|uniref:Uncharacterized protein n=1 Tax=Vaccinium darrowii TaxID=229202 RepID=A0ACB7X1G7_9ERIC|nr:hypothetical protein Vadar_015771 [Vaccinium darrowii]
MNELRKQGSPEANDELWSLANGPDPLINTYSGCISNGVRFHNIECDDRNTNQNSGVAVEGGHEGQTIDYYGRLIKVQQVYYIADTKLGDNWKVVERIQRRGIWNVPEMDSLETNNPLNEVFQQDTTTEVPPIDVEGGQHEGVDNDMYADEDEDWGDLDGENEEWGDLDSEEEEEEEFM